MRLNGLSSHRTVFSEETKIYSASPPFSSFDFIESRFNGINSLRRCFSLARSLGMETITLEKISPQGLILEENNELQAYFPDYKFKGALRLCFWKKGFKKTEELKRLTSRDFIGYAILKHDQVKSKRVNKWHVFEAVFKKYPNPRNFIARSKTFKISCGDRQFSIKGVLYCQQNSLNKACAQVALRSLLSNHLPEGDISYKKINELADITPESGREPGKGMTVVEIRRVLTSLDIGFRDVDYTLDDKFRDSLPYQKFIYAGVESGAGAMLGFRFSGPEIPDNAPPRHIIPFFGHTFNKDTWVPDAEISYFDVGGGVGYVPSENWTSSFIGHDDNFGPNYCVPRCHVNKANVDYVVELLNREVKYSGVHAEAVSLGFIYSLVPSIPSESKENHWIKRLTKFIRMKRIVLRAVFAKKKSYIANLKDFSDWEGNRESTEFLNDLEDMLPPYLWIIEISLPQLFPANERKIGEVVLNPFVEPNISKDVDFDLFLMARIPCYYFFLDSLEEGNPMFLLLDSNIKSHMPLIRRL